MSSLLVSVPALASAQEGNDGNNTGSGRPHMPGVFGTVSAVNGSTLTLESKGRGPDAQSAKTYTVDATNAVVLKNGATSTLSSVAVGDMVSAQGAVNGINVTATKLRDGMGMRGNGNMGRGDGQQHGMGQGGGAGFSGDGNPVVGGNVTAINGSSLTVTNKSNVTYTIDATNAKVQKGNSSSTVSAIVVGDNVLVQGTVNGTSVAASSVIDTGVAHTQNTNAPRGDDNTTAQSPQDHGNGGGFFGGIRNFFHNIFGFF